MEQALTLDWFGMDPNALPTGTHNYEITDDNGCTYSDNIIITEPNASINTTNVSCNGGTDGTVAVSVSGGTSPYLDWFGMDPNALPTGIHNYEITDDNGCTYSDFIFVSVSNASINTTNVSCNGGTDGTVAVSVSGGTSPYFRLVRYGS